MAPHLVTLILDYWKRQQSRLDTRMQRLLLDYARAESLILARVLARLASGASLTLRDRRRQEAYARQVLRAVDVTARTQIPPLVNQSFQIGRGLAEIGLDVKVAGLSRTNRDAMQLLTENLIEDLGAATATVGRTVEDAYRKEALRVALANVPGERPVPAQVSDLKEALRKQGLTSFTDRRGHRWSLETYSKMAVTTVTGEAINVSNLNILTERGIDLVQINAVDNPCSECLEYNGQTFSLTGRAQGYPVLRKRPPFHGNCRHFVFASPLALRERRESGWVREPSAELEEVA